jgi:hypothetical protein
MPEFVPSEEFEKKLKTAVAAPSADPVFVEQLRAQITAAQTAAGQQTTGGERPLIQTEAPPTRKPEWTSRLAQSFHRFTHNGTQPMRNRIIFPATAAVALLAVVAFFAINPPTPVSAQQILERATSAQSSAKPSQGIWHERIEVIDNPQALAGDGAGVKTTTEDYSDLASSLNRSVTTDASGKILSVYSMDGSYTYTFDTSSAAGSATPLVVTKIPFSQNPEKETGVADPNASAQALFEQFRTNPGVKLEGKLTWMDGSQAYALVDENYQTQKLADGKESKTLIGSTRMVFNAQTYALLESQTSLRKDGQDVAINTVLFLVDEILPANSPVAWDLRDLKGATFVDKSAQQPESSEVIPQPVTMRDLAGHKDVYALATIPDGFTLQIFAAAGQPQGQPYTYELTYSNPAKENFDLMAVGEMGPGFVAANFYDGSYVAANGMVLNFSSANPDKSTGGTSAILTLPDGSSFLLTSTFSREKVEALVENLVAVK